MLFPTVEYALYSSDPLLAEFFEFIKHHNLEFSAHLNRTRVHIPLNTAIHTEFLLRFTTATRVSPDELSQPV